MAKNLARRSAIAILAVASAAAPYLPLAAAPPAEIEASIARGVRFLERTQGGRGAWEMRGYPLGETALAGLALLAAGVPDDARAAQAAAAAVRALSPTPGTETYEVSLAIMFLDRLGDQGDVKTIRGLGRRLAAGQCVDGSWTYGLKGHPQSGDNSNTQFAALAGWIGRRYEAVPDDTLRRVDAYFRQSTSADGGWGYGFGGGSQPAMTCAGLVALAAEQGVERQRTAKARGDDTRGRGRDDGPARGVPAAEDPVVKAALAYLGQSLREAQPAIDRHGLYFYWSLERVGVIYGVRQIGGVDWYEWGASRLLAMQSRAGGWIGPDDGTVVDTAFALLFLCRANVAEDLTAELEGWAGGDTGGAPPRARQYMQVEKRRPREPEGPQPPAEPATRSAE